MFTGLIEALARVVECREAPPGRELAIDAQALAADVDLGDSIAINGCCLTVVRSAGSVLWFEAGPETLARTNLGRLHAGSEVNFERSLRLGERLGGHLVTGHIDALAVLGAREDQGTWATFWFAFPPPLGGQIASKGSIAVDGVSLTVVDVEPGRFSVALIPHTLAVTTLGRLAPGDAVNLETDLLAKYVERQLRGGSSAE